MNDNDYVCKAHSGVMTSLCAAKKMKSEFNDMWDEIKSKVGMRLFLTVFAIVFGFFGTIGAMQVAILTSVSDIDKRTAVIETTIAKVEKHYEYRITTIEDDIKLLKK